MAFVYVEVQVRGAKAAKSLRMLVDTGSTYMVLDPKLAEELGLLGTPYKVSLTLADGRRVEASLFLAEVVVAGRKGPVMVAAIPTPQPLLGVHALETLGFKVNPHTGQLEEISPEGGYLLVSSLRMGARTLHTK